MDGYALNDPSAGSAVIARKNKYRDLHKEERDPAKLAKAMAKVRAKKDKLEADLKELNAEYDVIRIELMPTLLDDLNLENIRVKGLGRVSLTGDIFCSVKGASQDGLFDWLRGGNPDKEALGDLIKETVNSSTLRSFVKDRMKVGKPIPDEFLNVTPYTRASITKV